jgi:hypothetical protein
MNRRAYILIAVLALGFVAMGGFLAWRNELPAGELRNTVLSGVLLVGIAVFAVKRERLGMRSQQVGCSRLRDPS